VLAPSNLHLEKLFAQRSGKERLRRPPLKGQAGQDDSQCCVAASPDLAGDDIYAKYMPLRRCVPLWGGVSASGFAPVTFHAEKNLKTEE